MYLRADFFFILALSQGYQCIVNWMPATPMCLVQTGEDRSSKLSTNICFCIPSTFVFPSTACKLQWSVRVSRRRSNAGGSIFPSDAPEKFAFSQPLRET